MRRSILSAPFNSSRCSLRPARAAARAFAVLTAVALALAATPFEARAADIQIKDFSIKGGRIAFTYSKGKLSDIYVLDFDSLEVYPLMSTPAREDAPCWSADGSKLLFQSDATGDVEIYSINADKTGLTQLTRSKGSDESACYSPDGKQIAFTSGRLSPGTQNQEVFVMNADGTNPTQLTANGKRNAYPRWSPRGTHVLFSTDANWPGDDVAMVNVKSKSVEMLTSGSRYFTRAAWNPKGSAFAFSYGAGKEDIDIYVKSIGEDDPEPLVVRDGLDFDASFIEDGKRVIFAGELNPGKGDFQLFMVDVETKEVIPVTLSDGAIRSPSWTPFPSLAAIQAKDAPLPVPKEKSELIPGTTGLTGPNGPTTTP